MRRGLTGAVLLAVALLPSAVGGQPSESVSGAGWYGVAQQRLVTLDGATEAFNGPLAGRELLAGIAGELHGGRIRFGGEVLTTVSGLSFGGVDVGALQGQLNLGYDPVTLGPLSLGPIVSLGVARRTIDFNAGVVRPFGDQLLGYSAPISVNRLDGIYGLALNVETMLPWSTTSPLDKTRRQVSDGVLVSLRVGYGGSLTNGSWHGPNGALEGGPGSALDGAYVRLAIGVGSQNSNSGSCTAYCGVRPNAQTTCNRDRCVYTCDSAYGDCDGDRRNGCEALLTTVDSCGRCGVKCTIEHGYGTCAVGDCDVAACEPNYANCDAFALNGCETDLSSDVKNCGACDSECAGGQSCRGGRCV